MHWIYTFVLIWDSSKRQFQSVYNPKTPVFLCPNTEIILLYYSSCNKRHPAWNMNYKNCIQSKWISIYTYFLSYCDISILYKKLLHVTTTHFLHIQYFNENLNIKLLLKSQIYHLIHWRFKLSIWMITTGITIM